MGSNPSHKNPTSELYGVNPVLEVLRAGHLAIEEILIAEGVHDERLRELIESGDP